MVLADDLFAGAGGWDIAAERLDIHARGVENMPEARQTRDAAGMETIHDDVWTFDPLGNVRQGAETTMEVYARVYRETKSLLIADVASGLIASPPCQTFSQAGKGSGRRALDEVLALLPRVEDLGTLEDLRDAGRDLGDPDDDRTALVLTPLWFLLHHQTYRWAAWEQVPAVLPVWEACATILRAKGWNVWTGYLHSEQYGVPQTRKRAFLLGSRDHHVDPPTPTHSRYHSRTPSRLDPGVAKWVSMAEALGWGRRDHPAAVVAAGITGPDEACDCPVTLTATNPRPHGAHRTPCQPAPTMAFGHEEPRWNPREETPDGLPRFAQQSDNDPDFDWPDNRPATVVAGRDIVQAPGATANRHNGSTKSRNDGVRVSVAEAGVLQSFPAGHPWQGKKGKQYLQAGNAVPPIMAEAALCAALGREYVYRGNPLDVGLQPPLDLPAEEIAYRNGTHDHAAVRAADRPAPTIMFGARSNRVTWEPGDRPRTLLDILEEHVAPARAERATANPQENR